MDKIYELIKRFQEGEKGAALLVLDKMKPRIRKYARMLEYEDAFYDLQLFVLECIAKIKTEEIDNVSDGAMVNYLYTSMYHKYVSVSKLLKEENKLRIVKPDNNNADSNTIGCEDDYSELFLYSISKLLTDRETAVIEGLYFRNMSVNEIADKRDLSNWNAYKIHDKALKKLKRDLA